MTRQQAIRVEVYRYLSACERGDTRKAHVHRIALDRLRYPYRARKVVA